MARLDIPHDQSASSQAFSWTTDSPVQHEQLVTDAVDLASEQTQVCPEKTLQGHRRQPRKVVLTDSALTTFVVASGVPIQGVMDLADVFSSGQAHTTHTSIGRVLHEQLM